MLLLDTHVLVSDALDPGRIPRKARKLIGEAEESRNLVCSDITLWEIAMLVALDRLDPGVDSATFMHTALEARTIRVLPVTPEIAMISAEIEAHADPADRIIAATAIVHGATLVTSDKKLRQIERLDTVWR